MEKTEKVMENHGIFCNLKSTSPEYIFGNPWVILCSSSDERHIPCDTSSCRLSISVTPKIFLETVYIYFLNVDIKISRLCPVYPCIVNHNATGSYDLFKNYLLCFDQS